MRLIIAGSRTLTLDYDFIHEALLACSNYQAPRIIPTEIVSGGARGIDKTGEDYARNWHVPLKIFHADWDRHGKAAGPARNKEMAEYADILLLIWDGESRGSANMKETMIKLGKPVYEIILREHNV